MVLNSLGYGEYFQILTAVLMLNNLDGGGSATLYFNGKVMNKLIGNTQRPCADFLYFTR